MSRRTLIALFRAGVAAVVLVLLLDRFGTGPFARAADLISWPAIVIAFPVTLVATASCAMRWTWTARRLDLGLDNRAALAAYYRSLFLNQVLPGGVLGDVDRAVRHGTTEAAIARASRAVVWERLIGQVVLVAVSVVVLVAIPGSLQPVWRSAPAASRLVIALVALVIAAITIAGVRRRHGRQAHGWVRSDIQRLVVPGVLTPLALSAVAVLAHLVLLETAMRVTGVGLPPLAALPMLLVVLLASSLPLNLAGWGPREGAAAWVFAASGLDASTGVTVAAVYGILSLLAALPGGALMVLDAWPGRVRREAS